MAFFSRIISNLLSRKEPVPLQIEFGKYSEDFTDSNKLLEARELFRKGAIIESYVQLFDFLQDPQADNLEYQVTNHKITFNFFQGSKLVEGRISEDKIFAISYIAKFKNDLPITLIEMLLQENHRLKYSKFVKTHSTIALQYGAPAQLTGPKDLYYALRELALVADGYDDVLVERFPDLQPVNIQHIEQLPDNEVKVKIDFIRTWIKRALSIVEKLSKDKLQKEQNKGLISYVLLDLIYKIYYLVAPEGLLLDFLKQLDQTYWQGSENIMQKNDFIYSAFQDLYMKKDDYFRKSLYRVKSTFSVVEPVKNARIIDFVSTELEGANWLRNQSQNLYLTVCEYIIGYLNFHIALKPGYRQLLNVLWRVLNDDYFLALGYKINFLSRGKLNSFAIEYQINKILNKYNLKGFRVSRLDYSLQMNFVKNFLNEFINLLTNESVSQINSNNQYANLKA